MLKFADIENCKLNLQICPVVMIMFLLFISVKIAQNSQIRKFDSSLKFLFYLLVLKYGNSIL